MAIRRARAAPRSVGNPGGGPEGAGGRGGGWEGVAWHARFRAISLLDRLAMTWHLRRPSSSLRLRAPTPGARARRRRRPVRARRLTRARAAGLARAAAVPRAQGGRRQGDARVGGGERPQSHRGVRRHPAASPRSALARPLPVRHLASTVRQHRCRSPHGPACAGRLCASGRQAEVRGSPSDSLGGVEPGALGSLIRRMRNWTRHCSKACQGIMIVAALRICGSIAMMQLVCSY